MASPNSNSNSKPIPATKPSYVSSSGNVLATPPLTARLTRLADDTYNFFGLYFASLFSLDSYTAAQNSQFNTRGRVNAYQERSRWGGVNRSGGTIGGSGRGGGSGGNGGSGGSGFGGAGGSGRRMGTVDDVRGPECGSGSCG